MAVTMKPPGEKWTDDRLDDLSNRMDREFDLVRTEIKSGFNRVDARFNQVDERFDRFEKRFERLEGQFAALNRILIGGAIAFCASVLVGSIF